MVCLFDPRFAKLRRGFTEHSYFARGHVIVSHAGDTRGIVEELRALSLPVRVERPDREVGTRILGPESSVLSRYAPPRV